MNIIIFDTETIGKVSQDLINVGYRIVDLNPQDGSYTTLLTRDYLVTRLVNDRTYCINDDFVGAGKWALWQDALANKKAIKRKLESILKTFSNDLKRLKVLFGYAYNCNFDLDKFQKASEQTGLPNPFSAIPVFDIWSYAYEYICKQDDYITYCQENEILTPTGQYIQTSVEGVCKYLYRNTEFKETHTALDDTAHELTILCECVRRGADITKVLPKAKFIASGKEFQEEIVLPTGQKVEIAYTKKVVRGNRTTYKV